MSLAELLFRHEARLPLDLLKPDLHQHVETKHFKQKVNHNPHSVNQCFDTEDPVFASNFGRGSRLQQ